LVAHYTALASATTKPIILYNVPSRTGVNIAPSTYAKLAQIPNVVAIKEANGNISSVVETATLAGDVLDIYCGNDDQIVPIMACGGKGVISVLSNVLPKETTQLCRKFFDGDVAGAMELQKKYLPLTNALFCEVNPIPVKAAMAAMGFCENYLRMPLVPMEEEHRAMLLKCMRDVGLNV
jgi:4-hydroxy-tetrahydrodipicolinate synthase